MSIHLSEVDHHMVDRVVELHVREDQKDLVFDNRYFLSRINNEQYLRPLAIFFDDTLVGFCIYATDEDDGYVQILSLMIDARHQGKGYSVQALKALLEKIGTEANPQAVYAEIRSGNHAAESIFAKAGFSLTGERNGSDVEWMYRYSEI